MEKKYVVFILLACVCVAAFGSTYFPMQNVSAGYYPSCGCPYRKDANDKLLKRVTVLEKRVVVLTRICASIDDNDNEVVKWEYVID